MAKSAEVLLRGIDADIAGLKGQLADLQDLRARVVQYAMKGAHRNGAAPKREYHRRLRERAAPTEIKALRPRNGKPGVGGAVMQFVRANPGLPKKEAIKALVAMGVTDKPNAKKVFQTRVGQLLIEGLLRQEGEGNRLFVNP